MKKFGEKFDRYEPLEIERVSIADENRTYRVLREASSLLETKGGSGSIKELEAELNKSVVEVASAANVYQISPDQKDLSDFIKKTLTWFNYYVVELGLNVMVGRKCSIPELLFKVILMGDGNTENVVAYDIAPKDETEYRKLLSGNVKIALGVTTFLKFIPVPLGEHVSNLLNVDINPWEFEWGIEKYMIDACGEKSCDVYWKIYETSMVQGFNPAMIVRAKKEVNKISANARCVYKLKTGWCDITPRIDSKEREVIIWPV
jgi:hypothetical protein